MADLLLLGLVVALLALAVYLLRKDRQATRLEQMRIRKLRNSELYARIYRVFRRISSRDIETIRIRPEDVCITLISQPGRGFRFDIPSMGYRPLTEDEMVSMALSLERDISVLADRSRYRMHREVRVMPNGAKAHQYTYVVRHHYKDAISRAEYYSRKAA